MVSVCRPYFRSSNTAMITLGLVLILLWGMVLSHTLEVDHDNSIGKECNSKLFPVSCKCWQVRDGFGSGVELRQKTTKIAVRCEGLHELEALQRALLLLWVRQNSSEDSTQENYVVLQLFIKYSNIKHMPKNALTGLEMLQSLDLSSNQLTSLSSGILSKVLELQKLDLSNNSLTQIRKKWFSGPLNLLTLSLAKNNIETIELGTFQQFASLERLNLTLNSLKEIQDTWFANLSSLMELSLSDNQISIVSAAAFQGLYELSILNLSSNHILNLDAELFVPLQNMKMLVLSYNNLTSLPATIFDTNIQLKHLFLAGNLLACTEELEWLYNWTESNQSSILEDKEFIICHNSGYQGMSLRVRVEVFKLEKRIEESPLCRKCACTVERNQFVAVNCTRRNLDSAPENLPYNTRLVRLGGNRIRSLANLALAPDWKNVAFLHLDNNHIGTLQGFEGSPLLQRLILLNLSMNWISEIHKHVLEQIPEHLEIFLAGNPWKCECNTLPFMTWLQDHHRQVLDIEGIRCGSNRGVNAGRVVYRLLRSDLCPQQTVMLDYLNIVNGLMAVLIVLIFSKLTYDYWLQKHTGKLPKFFKCTLP